jgi:undecaprenyl diphosphate synthase
VTHEKSDSRSPAAAGSGVDLPRDKLPRHIAFIMDGNGRWARGRGLPRLRGHETGATSLRRITRYTRALGIREITFFALSSENFTRRPAREVDVLLRLLSSYLTSERNEMLENDIRLKVIGHVEAFPADLRRLIDETCRATEHGRSMILRLALNYGGQQEILDAAMKIAEEVRAGRLSPDGLRALGLDGFRRYLHDPEMSDPDLLIRTAGEFRISNFLLWQCAYAEIWVTNDLWPAFDIPRLEEALLDYCSRERKFGALSRQDTVETT